jgi:hypothetical protein
LGDLIFLIVFQKNSPKPAPLKGFDFLISWKRAEWGLVS